jgi:hypothetical protein
MNTQFFSPRRAKRCAALCMCLFILLVPRIAVAQDITPEWIAKMPVTEYYWYTGEMLALDAAGNTYVAGHHLFNYLSTTKWDTNGNLVWEKLYIPTTGQYKATWINVDPTGNIVVTGTSYTGSGGDQNTTGWIVLKYDALGNLLWDKTIAYTRGKTVRMELDSAGNIYVVGRAWFGTDDILTKKFAPDGTELWTKQLGFDGTSIDVANSIAVTPAGDVAVTGGPLGWMLVARYDKNTTRATPLPSGRMGKLLSPESISWAQPVTRQASSNTMHRVISSGTAHSRETSAT